MDNNPIPVNFLVLLVDGADRAGIKRALEQLANDIAVTDPGQDSLITLMEGRTTQRTYESVFGAKIEFEKTTKTVDGQIISYGEWVPKKDASVPAGFSDTIDCIALNRVNFPIPVN